MKKIITIPLIIIALCILFCNNSDDDLPEIKIITFQKDHLYNIKSECLSNDGKYKVTAGIKYIIIKETNTGDILHRFRIPISFMGKNIDKMNFNKDKSLLTLTMEGYELNFSTKTSSLIGMNINDENSKNNTIIKEIPSFFKDIDLSEDKSILVISTNDDLIKFWSVFNAEMLSTIQHKDLVSLTMNPYGNEIYVTDKNGILTVYNTEDINNVKLKETRLISGFTKNLSNAVTNETGRVVITHKVTEEGENRLYLYKPFTNKITEKLIYKTNDKIISLACNGVGDRLAISLVDKLGKPYIITSNLDFTDVKNIKLDKMVNFIKFDRNDKIIFHKNAKNELTIYDTNTKTFENIQTGITITNSSVTDIYENIMATSNIYDQIILTNTDNPQNSFVLNINKNEYYFYSKIDGIFDVSNLDSIRYVKNMIILPKEELNQMHNQDKLIKRLYEYRGYISEKSTDNF